MTVKGITPTPWKVVGPGDGWGNSVAVVSEADESDCVALSWQCRPWPANARYIVHTANEYPALVKLIQEFYWALNQESELGVPVEVSEWERLREEAKSVLTRARKLEE